MKQKTRPTIKALVWLAVVDVAVAVFDLVYRAYIDALFLSLMAVGMVMYYRLALRWEAIAIASDNNYCYSCWLRNYFSQKGN